MCIVLWMGLERWARRQEARRSAAWLVAQRVRGACGTVHECQSRTHGGQPCPIQDSPVPNLDLPDTTENLHHRVDAPEEGSGGSRGGTRPCCVHGRLAGPAQRDMRHTQGASPQGAPVLRGAHGWPLSVPLPAFHCAAQASWTLRLAARQPGAQMPIAETG